MSFEKASVKEEPERVESSILLEIRMLKGGRVVPIVKEILEGVVERVAKVC